MGWPCHDRLPCYLCLSWILCWNVRCWWWNCQRSIDVSHGCPSRSRYVSLFVIWRGKSYCLNATKDLVTYVVLFVSSLFFLLTASASSACMILFTSFTAATSFFVFGLLDEQYAPVCFVIGFVATYFGQIGLSILMKRAQRNSYIAFSIGGVVFLSAVLMTVQSLLSMAEGEHHSSGGICGKDS